MRKLRNNEMRLPHSVTERQAVAKDAGGRLLAVRPDRHRGFEMNHVDLMGAVEQRIGQGEAYHLRLCAGDHSTKQTGAVGREIGIGDLPCLGGRFRHGDAAKVAGGFGRSLGPLAKL